ncbi:methylmalonyl-CoA mutase subunit beta [Flavobacterium sp. NKUCC04_CG]|uniref:methylmalonyl-CoA mutase subunit beta n=1 Tax=Flavobacterium sp. NKUCC04_CG TaxID=2842121 RepID=UPI001C5BCFFF|nr:methylmalonyl-CoA mutase subunit beta [Flavobacterium sp. NKUCC04_CG]MBW3520390.1 methylmalonyl-CoA mutase subunit beta [Flavobacterium sp. NKUCC04_CG]
MTKKLFEDFEKVSSKEWKNLIQYELKGADYNDTLVWESLEGIKVRPFYHFDDTQIPQPIPTSISNFSILQDIFVFDVDKSISRALKTLERGAEVLRFTVEDKSLNLELLLASLPIETVEIFLSLGFLDLEYIQKINAIAINRNATIWIQVDPIAQLAKDGNWYSNLDRDFKILNNLYQTNLKVHLLSVDSSLYQNAGANMVQQIAYTLAHANEYLNRIENNPGPLLIEVAVGTNYFFEIAKLRALRWLLQLVGKEYQADFSFKILASPTKRNKTIYDYNVNMLRTTTECMSAILGGADVVTNLPYDALYHKDNEFGDRIARNQLLILKQESYFDIVDNPAEGSYYIENLTQQLAEKALELFKDIEANGGFITQLIEGTVQRKINESAQKEQTLFDSGKETLLGTNKYPNPQDKMAHDLELFPFVKSNPRKTLIVPIIERRLAENLEQQRLEAEKNNAQ